MQITDIKIRKRTDDGKMKAIVSITLDQSLAVHDIKVIKGENKLFVAMPSRKMSDGVFRDIVHPIHQQMREDIEKQIIERYLSETEEEVQTEDEKKEVSE